MKKNNYKNMIGDGKLPNLYWVGLSNDYGYVHDGCIDGADEVIKDFKSIGKMITKPFTTYKGAKKYCDDLYLGQKIDNFILNRITIEDRLTGQVYEKTKILNIPAGEFRETEYEDIRFSEKRIEELGGVFK